MNFFYLAGKGTTRLKGRISFVNPQKGEIFAKDLDKTSNTNVLRQCPNENYILKSMKNHFLTDFKNSKSVFLVRMSSTT